MAPCIVIDVYVAPGSLIDQTTFYQHKNWVDYVFAVPNTYWGDRSPNINLGRLDIRWRFRDAQGNLAWQNLNGPIVHNPQVNPNSRWVLRCPPDLTSNTIYAQYYNSWFNYRPAGPGPFGQTRTLDLAVYYVAGPFADRSTGCSLDGLPVIIIPNPPNGEDFEGGPILAHEIGHLLGLPHTINGINDPNNLTNNLMHENVTFRSYLLTGAQWEMIIQNQANPSYFWWQSCV